MSNTQLIELAQGIAAGTAEVGERLKTLDHVVERVIAEREMLRAAVLDLLKVIEEISDNTEGKYPSLDSGCIECTQGATPDDCNTGPCAWHRARRQLKTLLVHDAAERIFAACTCDGSTECAHCIELRRGAK